jgi:hypothetical protein
MSKLPDAVMCGYEARCVDRSVRPSTTVAQANKLIANQARLVLTQRYTAGTWLVSGAATRPAQGENRNHAHNRATTIARRNCARDTPDTVTLLKGTVFAGAFAMSVDSPDRHTRW